MQISAKTFLKTARKKNIFISENVIQIYVCQSITERETKQGQ